MSRHSEDAGGDLLAPAVSHLAGPPPPGQGAARGQVGAARGQQEGDNILKYGHDYYFVVVKITTKAYPSV